MDHEHFLVIPHGMLYYEVTAASLARVDMQGETVDAGCTNLQVNRNAFALHSTIHAARPDIKSIIHLRNPTAVAVSLTVSVSHTEPLTALLLSNFVIIQRAEV